MNLGAEKSLRIFEVHYWDQYSERWEILLTNASPLLCSGSFATTPTARFSAIQCPWMTGPVRGQRHQATGSSQLGSPGSHSIYPTSLWCSFSWTPGFQKEGSTWKTKADSLPFFFAVAFIPWTSPLGQTPKWTWYRYDPPSLSMSFKSLKALRIQTPTTLPLWPYSFLLSLL